MRIEAGISPSEPIVSSPEKNRLSPSEIQDLIYDRHLESIKYPSVTIKKDSLGFYKEYKEKPEGINTIDKLKALCRNLTNEDIQEYFVGGLSTNIVVAKRIPELSGYQQKDFAEAFFTHFSLVAQSINRIYEKSVQTPSKIIIKQLIKHPNYFKPNFYESLVRQLKNDGYMNKTSIIRFMLASPKNAEETLGKNNTTFEIIKNILKKNDPKSTIDYGKLRQLVDTQNDKAIDTVNKNPINYYLTLNQQEKKVQKVHNALIEKVEELLTQRIDPLVRLLSPLVRNNSSLNSQPDTLIVPVYPDISARCQEAARKISESHHPIPELSLEKPSEISAKTAISLTKEQKSTATINSLKEKIRYLEKENQKLSKNSSIRITALEINKQQLEATINDFQRQVRSLTEKNQRLSKALSIKATNPDNTPLTQPTPTPDIRVNFEPKIPTEQTQKEETLTPTLVPSHPIDYVSSANLTLEQKQKIEEIKAKNLNDSFTQDWVIEYYVVNYPNNPEKKLEEDLNKLIAWRETLSDENFKDSWILRHFIVYYPNDYKNRYLEAQNAFKDLKSKFGEKEFATPDILKNIVVYYYENRIDAVQKGILLLKELKKEFFGTELIKSNSSKISRYIIRNFNNPVEDLRKATEQYNLLLKNAIETPGDFFHSQGENEFSSDDYLQLLFESYPMPTESSIAKIKDAYQKLQTQFSYDNFFGKYKKSALKKISISSTEKFALGYFKLKRIIEKDVDDPKNKGIDPEKIVRIHLFTAENRISISLDYCRNYYRQNKFSSAKKSTQQY